MHSNYQSNQSNLRSQLLKLAAKKGSGTPKGPRLPNLNIGIGPNTPQPIIDNLAAFLGASTDSAKAGAKATTEQAARDAAAAANAAGKKGLSRVGEWLGGHGNSALATVLGAGATALGAKLFKRPPTMKSQIKGALGNALGFGIAGTALGAGVLAANKGYGAIADPIIKQRSYERMLAANPSLKHEDKDVTQRSFNTLYKFNPDMAKDPTTAGSFVRRAAMFKDEGIQSADIKTLAEIRKNMSESTKGSPKFMDQGSGLFSFRDRD